MIRSTIVSFCHEAVLLDVVEVEAGKEVPLTNVSFSFPMVYRRKFSALVKNLVEKEEMFHFEYSSDNTYVVHNSFPVSLVSMCNPQQ